MTERNEIYDIVKGIGCILVIMGHCHHFFSYDSNIYMYIYNFHMPLFSVVSGCVLNIPSNKIGYKEFVYKKFDGIIIPYVFASLLSIIYALACGENCQGYFVSVLIGNTQNNNLAFNVPLWYCPMIFIALVIFYTGNKSRDLLKKEYLYFILIVVISGCGYLLLENGIRLPWSIETALFVQIFVYLGEKLKKYIKNSYNKKQYIVLSLLLIVFFIIYNMTYTKNGRVDMNSGVYGNICLYMTNAILAIAIVFLFSIFIRKGIFVWKILAYLGKNSLYIMMFHRLAADFAQSEIINFLLDFISRNLWNANIIGVTYWVVISIIFSLFWGAVYKSLIYGHLKIS